MRGLKNSRRAQLAIILVLVIGLWGLFVLLLSSGSKPKSEQKEGVDPGKVAVKAITAPGEVVTDAQRWLYKAGDDIAVLKGRVSESDTQNKELVARLQKLEEELKHQQEAGKGAAPARADYPPGSPSNPGQARPGPKFIPPPVPGQAATTAPATTVPVAAPLPPRPGIGRISLAAFRAPQAPAAAPQGGPQATPALPPSGKADQAGKPDKDSQRQVGKTFLPIGFVKARLLGGIDAPTSGSGQSNPLPVFLHIEDLAWLPNHWRANVKDCMVTTAAYGDLSSERAYFRLEKLSCVRHDGQVLEQNVSGTVYGEDGKVGMRGRLVSKQGQILANALLAGVVSGIGRGIVYQSSTTGVTALGTTVTEADPGKEFQTGMAQGVNTAMDRLAQYYISLADKSYPVIEIDAQRQVDIAFTRGTSLDVPLPDQPDLLSMRRGDQ
ncbi:conjugal transfer protein TraB [Parasulfuritortus cantonensis]|uniref:Conjugal transfer protein TraB n=1 Tax=Parasulfuritortus cantonensis TaxID=2528202 RepID=A0A4R1BR19_9PROT|nr:TrbI/VirB10 family protein [Parasulfuritortus cantonensis]TCJ20174.1 conjugal transfer protein TraB [Parasulfuritortus cantonensis]